MFESVRVSARANPTVLVLGQFKGEALDRQSAKRDTDGWIKDCATRPEAGGELGGIAEVSHSSGFARTILLGLGGKDDLTTDALRHAAGMLGRRLAKIQGGAVEIDLAGAIKGRRIKPEAAGRAFGEGLGLIAFSHDEFRGKATTVPTRPKLTVSSDDAEFAKGLKVGLALAEGANLARMLSNTPPNICSPDFMAQQAKALARATGMKCTVLKGAQLEKERMTGLINVGKASDHTPCLIRLEYAPSGTASQKPAVLVGKTMTYDSGGLSLKVGGSMLGMKRDKDGGCAVLGAMHAIATTLKPKRRVVALLAAAENAISDEAYRPDDILTFRNGVTVEVTNTDAEGRLVLADALCWACEKEKPAYIVDVATLTGGVVVALGSTFAGLWCDDEDLRKRIEGAAETTGERVWRLPHHSEYRDMMRSSIADIHNSAPVREAHPIQGAAFLSYFVDENIPWAHIDIAGTHATTKDKGPYTAGPTGYGARLLAEIVSAG